MSISKRGSTYHLRRRVPRRYESVEERKIVYLSLKTDSMINAQRRADGAWEQLLAQWEALLRSDTALAKLRYQAAKDLAQAHDMPFLHADEVAKLPLKDLVDRVHMTFSRDGEIDDRKARAFLGTIEQPGMPMTECLEVFFEITREEEQGRSPNQLRVNGGVKTGHAAAQNQASGRAPSAMARALAA